MNLKIEIAKNVEKNDRTEMYGTEREETQMEITEQYPGYDHRVQYYETDQMGCVHHSNYIRWFEESRSDYLAYLSLSLHDTVRGRSAYRSVGEKIQRRENLSGISYQR